MTEKHQALDYDRLLQNPYIIIINNVLPVSFDCTKSPQLKHCL